jgi:hypothetical protein
MADSTHEVLQPAVQTSGWAGVQAALAARLAASEPFACLVIAIDRIERCKDDAAREQQHAQLDKHLRERPDLARAVFGTRDELLWLLVPGVTSKDSSTLARALVDGVRKARMHFTISAGVAANRAGVRAEVLILVAEEGLSVARNGGGDRAVHTDLYDLVQKKLTGEHIPAFKEVAPAPPAAPVLRQVELRSAHAPADAPASAEPERVEPASSSASARRGDEQVEVLERRIAKLMGELAQAQDRIAQLEHSTSGGIASIYREVQGLAPTERLFDLKRELMASIFEANLALRAVVAS